MEDEAPTGPWGPATAGSIAVRMAGLQRPSGPMLSWRAVGRGQAPIRDGDWLWKPLLCRGSMPLKRAESGHTVLGGDLKFCI